jgi:outer membrane protein TolC
MSSADTFVRNYSAYLPRISASANRSRSKSISEGADGKTSISGGTGLSGSLTLYDFGQREFTIDSAELALAAAGYGYDSSLQSAIATAISGYYSLLTAQNAIEVSKESNKFARESFEAANLRYELGLVPLADLLQAKVSYADSELGVQQAENSLAITRASLARLLGLSPDAEIAVEEIDDSNLLIDPFNSKLKELIEMAKEKRVDLAATRAGLESSRIALKALKRSNLASVSINASGGFDDLKLFNSQTTRSQSVGISVSVPIFTGFNETYSTRIAERGIIAQEEGLKRAELGIEQEVWNAWHNYDNAKQNWEISWDRLASATQLRDVELARYREGLSTILNVLSAQSAYRGALQSHLTTRLNLLTSRVTLIRAVGALNLESIVPDETETFKPVKLSRDNDTITEDTPITETP